MTVDASETDHDDPQEPEGTRRRRLDGLSIAALTVISLAIAIFVTLVIVEVFGEEADGSVDVTEALETSAPNADDPAGTLEVGSTAPDVELELLGGGTVSIEDLRGAPVVVNFWSSTCAPCVTEMPEFESVHRDLGDAVVFLGVDVTDTVEAGKEMVEQTGVTYRNGRDPRAEVMGAFGGTVLPRTVILDRQGTVVATHSGALTAEELKGSLSEQGLI